MSPYILFLEWLRAQFYTDEFVQHPKPHLLHTPTEIKI